MLISLFVVLTLLLVMLILLLGAKHVRARIVRVCVRCVSAIVLLPLIISAGYLLACLCQTAPEELPSYPQDIELTVHQFEQFASPAIAYIAKIKLDSVDLELTPANGALTTSVALAKYDADIAVNASFFGPFRDNHVFDYYPHSGDMVKPVGVAFSGNSCAGRPNPKWPYLYKTSSGDWRVGIGLGSCLEHINAGHKFALAGKSWFLKQGDVVVPPDEDYYPRTILAIDTRAEILWLVVVDGKQPGYSKGIPLYELAKFLKTLGGYNAIELDGGGSSTMALRLPNGDVDVINRPAHTKIPRRERPVANHLLVKIN